MCLLNADVPFHNKSIQGKIAIFYILTLACDVGLITVSPSKFKILRNYRPTDRETNEQFKYYIPPDFSGQGNLKDVLDIVLHQ